MGDYIDLEDFQKFTRTTYTESTVPTADYVNELIDESEAEINEDTGRTWKVESYVDELYDLPQDEVLLKNYPIITVSLIKDGDLNELTEGIDEDYTVDGDFIVWNKNKIKPDRCYITYTAGYTGVRKAAKRLTELLTVQKLSQSDSSSQNNTKSVKLGPISIDKALGMQTVVNLDSDIKRYWKKLRRLIR